MTHKKIHRFLFLLLVILLRCTDDEKPVEPMLPPVVGPSVTIISPSGPEVLDTAAVVVETTDDKGVVKVEVYIDNQIPSGGSFVVPPYTYSWDVSTLPDSSIHTVYAKAYDADDNVTTTSVLTVTSYWLRPSDLTTIVMGDSVVQLNWQDNSRRETGYEVQMKVDENLFGVVRTVGTDTTMVNIQVTDFWCSSLKFRIAGLSGLTRSRFSNIDSAMISHVVTINDLFDLHFIDANSGWAVGDYGAIIGTTDGGISWTSLPVLSSPLYSVFFINSLTGWAVGKSAALSTADGGMTWAIHAFPDWFEFESVYFLDSFHGWAAGNLGLLYETTDGGGTWTQKSSGTTEILFSVYFVNELTGWVVGDGGLILNTTDGGGTWNKVPSGNQDRLRTVFFVDELTGWVAGGSQILHTDNGGMTWKEESAPEVGYRSLYFVDELTGWMSGDRGNIFHTTNGGDTWYIQHTEGSLPIHSIQFSGHLLGWAVGGAGLILRTKDGGATWNSEVCE